MKAVINLNKCAVASNIVGLAVSVYAYVIELKKEHDPDYKPFCDINEHISCSKAFMSEYGKGFGVVKHLVGEDSVLNQPNCLMGILFYSILAVLSCANSITWTRVFVGLSAISNIFSIYLAYILAFILHDLCVVCIATYVVNFINLLVSVIKLRRLLKPQAPKTSSSRKRKKKN